MSGKWVQAENAKDEKLDVYVWVGTPEAGASRGVAEVVSPVESPQLLDRSGKPLSPARPRRVGFDPERLT